MTKRNVYSSEILVWATIYAIAETEEEARQKIRSWDGRCLTVGMSGQVTDIPFESLRLPDVSVSPYMTIAANQVEDMIELVYGPDMANPVLDKKAGA